MALTFELTQAEAIVLFEFLSRSEESENITMQHPAEQAILSRLLATLERELVEPFAPNYEQLLQLARNEVASPEPPQD